MAHDLRSSRMRVSYLAALAVIALIAIVGNLRVRQGTAVSREDASIVNLAGRQRMWSQRIARCSLELAYGRNASTRLATEEQLREALIEIRRGHDWLRGQALGGPEAAARLEAIEELLDELTEQAAATGGDKRQREAALEATLDATEEFLPAMDRLVGVYQQAAVARVEELGLSATLGMWATLFVLLFEYLLVFEPLRRATLRRVDELRSAHEEAIERAREKGAFLAQMSHEFRTPLNGVVGINELLLETELTADQRKLAQTVHGSANTLVNLINQVLEFARVSSGRLETERERIEPVSVVEEAVQTVIAGLDEDDVEIVIDPAGDLPEWIESDPLRIGQVLRNLIGNAAKFTDHGHILVRIFVDGPVLVYEVQDSGIGIPEDRIEAIFEEFTQAEVSTTRKYGGTGLGLAISRSLVEALGGRLTARSTPGIGSTFRIELPRETSTRGARSKPPARPYEGRRIAIVEPNSVARRVLAGRLTNKGACVSIYEGPRPFENATRDRREPFDLMMVDRRLLWGDGSRFLSTCREVSGRPDLPVVVMDSVRRASPPNEFDDQPAVLRLDKPIREVQLNRVLAEALDGVRPATSARADDEPRVVIEHLRVLAAEDGETNQHLLRAHLDRFGCEYVLVEDGEAAVEAALRGRFDLILMDCQMPLMDGYEATRRIRALPEYADVPIIALTANAMPEDRKRCLRAGMDDHLAKPYRKAALIEALTRWGAAGRGERARVS